MNLITDRQTTWNGGSFPSQYDTVKVFEGDREYYKHGDETFATKNALRKALSSEYDGAWIEEKDGKKRYFINESGWLKRSIREVSKEEFAKKLESPSTWQKVLGIGLGILALAPGAVEFARHIPKEAGLGLLALQQKSPLLGTVGYSCLPSTVDAQAMGTEFQVNTNATYEPQRPSVTSFNDGRFVVTWQSLFLRDIYGQRYNASGARAGVEFQVNTYPANTFSSFPLVHSVAPLNDGGFVVTWTSNGQDGDSWGIFGQRYNASGAQAGTEFQVNSYTTGNQAEPSVAALDDGGFVVSWESDGQDGDSWGIFGQRYNATGAQVGTEFQVNTYTTNWQLNPSVAPLNDGGFVVTWASNGQDGDGYGIYGQRYDATGAQAGTEFQVNTYTTSHQTTPSIAPLNDGGFVVSWQSFGQDGDSSGIFGQRYDATGAQAGTEFQVNTYTTDDQRLPNVAHLNDGGFVVTWMSDGQDGSGTGIFGQRYNATGARIGTEFQVNTYTTNYQQYPSVAPLNDGGFVITWDSYGQDGSGTSIYGQRYDRNGNPVGLTVQIQSSGLPSQMNASAFQSNLSSSPSQIFGTSSPNLDTSGITAFSSNSNQSQSYTSSPSSMITPASSTIPSSTSRIPAFSNIIIYSVIDIVYGENYPIYVNGQTVGTFTISGGSGQLDSSNPNVITMHFNPSYYPEEGESIPLFSIPPGQGSAWQNIQLQENTFVCLVAREEIVSGSAGSNYQLTFDFAPNCASNASQILISAIAMATN